MNILSKFVTNLLFAFIFSDCINVLPSKMDYIYNIIKLTLNFDLKNCTSGKFALHYSNCASKSVSIPLMIERISIFNIMMEHNTQIAVLQVGTTG